ncbi:endo-alpha-N-acetylgalactosaminidase family protein [Paenibacillus paridis]|uniref:endo-alpha-N-acetylgalactosaminidase family protein n=1 Tax=Paenibacillus paridis TaxID=2583376 RepID=UPI00111F8018|nr:endo-alpha-N-acetylgalactosaminidase family protein [Paenibacillus paridis]
MYKLENELLAVQLYDWPGIKDYLYKASNTKLLGSGPDGKLAVNGKATEWEEWEIAASVEAGLDKVSYLLHWRHSGLRMNMEYRLEQNMVKVRVEVQADPAGSLERLDWLNQPLLACEQPDFSFARTEVHQKSWKLIPGGGRGLYDRKHALEKISDAIPDHASVPTMHTCVFDGQLCCFVHTNYPVIPLLSEIAGDERYPGRGSKYRISLNTYQYRVRSKAMEPLELKIVFQTDLNGDGIADECDYQLWMNRQFPDAHPMYKEAIWYKVFNAEKKRGVLTSFKEMLEIIRQIHHITGGMPQIAYMTGWQFDGHDTGYPSINRVNPKLAENPDRAQEELLELVRRAREEYNCIVSYHINLDDAYRDTPDWSPDIISHDPDGAKRIWIDTKEGHRAYHISHTKDVESGKVFERIDQFLQTVPVHRTVHIDAFRNTNASWEEDGYIGPVEELVCGMKPIIAYFNERGIDVTTEGQNGMPIEDGGLFSAYWHYSPSLMYHGKIAGGGSVDMDAITWGKGASFDSDILYRGEPSRLPGEHFLSNDFKSKWNQIVDILYLGSMLYRFYLSREMVEWRENEERVDIRYGDGVTVNIVKATEQLAVQWGSVTIADNDNRFIPMDNHIYMYSRGGTDRAWTLPEDWNKAEFRAYRLSGNGKQRIDSYQRADGSIQIKLEPHVPVLLEKI